MIHQEDRFVRFQDWTSERSLSTEALFSERRRKPFSSTLNVVKRALEWGTEIIRNIFHYRRPEDSVTKDLKSRKKILDPQGPFLQKWNKIFVLSCVMAVSVDPLFFYIPIVDHNKQCIDMDSKLEITASVLRSFTDIFYIIHIIFQFRTGFMTPSRVLGRGALVEDLSAIARRYLSSYFFIDILAVLPLPQVVVLLIIPRLKGSSHLDVKNLLMLIVVLQYVPRLIRVYPLYREVTKSAGLITETAWAGAAFNLLLYMLASHVKKLSDSVPGRSLVTARNAGAFLLGINPRSSYSSGDTREGDDEQGKQDLYS